MYCIYHSADLDGYCSGAIVKKKYPDAILIGYNYGQPIPFEQIKANQPVIMVDVSLSMSDMVAMGIHSGGQFTWIDHHLSPITDYKALEKESPTKARFINGVFNTEISACEITWGYCFPDTPMPVSVDLLGQYDTFRTKGTTAWSLSVLPFQYGMRSINITSAETFPQYLLNDIVPIKDITDIIQTGDIILNYQKQQDTSNMQDAFEAQFEGLRAICFNGVEKGTMAFDSVYNEDKHDLMLPFKFDGNKWVVSLYTTKAIDCSAIAKKYGGGGHAQAAGFILDELPDFLNQ